MGCVFHFVMANFETFLIIPNFYEDCTKINPNIGAVKYQSC